MELKSEKERHRRINNSENKNNDLISRIEVVVFIQTVIGVNTTATSHTLDECLINRPNVKVHDYRKMSRSTRLQTKFLDRKCFPSPAGFSTHVEECKCPRASLGAAVGLD